MLTRCLTAAALAAPLTLAMVPPAPAQDQPIPVIISSDTATGLANGWRQGVSDIDDGLAIAMALTLPELDVRMVAVTWGNNLMEPEAEIAQRVVLGMGADIPVVRGASRPLPQYPVTLYDGSVVDSACLNKGLRSMAAELAASSEPITLIAIGPLTDVACLALNFPAAAGRIDKVVVIGGRAPGEAFDIDGVYLSDFNMVLDMAAVQYLLKETTLPLQFMPFGLTSSVLVPASDRRHLCASDLPLATDFFCPAVQPWIKQWRRRDRRRAQPSCRDTWHRRASR
jgi:pyrimidine-specific ribonucleoside hydrolase